METRSPLTPALPRNLALVVDCPMSRIRSGEREQAVPPATPFLLPCGEGQDEGAQGFAKARTLVKTYQRNLITDVDGH